MKVAVVLDYDADIIDCPEELAKNIREYRNGFLDWLYDKRNEHAYWIYKDGKKFGCCYRADAFLEWLNKFVLADSPIKAKLLENGTQNWDKNLPSIYF